MSTWPESPSVAFISCQNELNSMRHCSEQQPHHRAVELPREVLMSIRTALSAALSVLTILVIGCSGNRIPPFPPTEKHPVTDEYYGIKIVDDYRWLDDLSRPEVRKWNDAQN